MNYEIGILWKNSRQTPRKRIRDSFLSEKTGNNSHDEANRSEPVRGSRFLTNTNKKASVETPASKTSVYDNHFILNVETMLFILEKPRLRKNASGATTKKTKQCLKS